MTLTWYDCFDDINLKNLLFFEVFITGSVSCKTVIRHL